MPSFPRPACVVAFSVLVLALSGGQSGAEDKKAKSADNDYKRVVQASWYGPNFAGRPTASGEIFDPSALTAAHKSLPFGTKLQVTSLHNGRTVTVVVNDRGPFIEDRAIDLSREAARRLDMIQRGVATVLIERR